MLLLLLLLSSEDPIAAIKKYRQDGQSHWLPPADVAARALSTGGWKTAKPHQSPAEFLNESAEAAGYQVNSFRRQIRVAEFLRAQLGEQYLANIQASPAPVSALEMVARLHTTEPLQALELLPQVIAGKVGFLEVKKRYTASLQGATQRASLRSSAKLREVAFGKTCQLFFQKHQDLFFLPEEIVGLQLMSIDQQLSYARPEFAFIGSAPSGDGRFADAIDCKSIGTDNSRSTVLPFLEQSALLAMQFRRVWVAFPHQSILLDGPRRVVESLASGLDELGLQNVGIVLVPEDGLDPTPADMLIRTAIGSNEQTQGQKLTLKRLWLDR